MAIDATHTYTIGAFSATVVGWVYFDFSSLASRIMYRHQPGFRLAGVDRGRVAV
jgi:hypothetical protein